MRIGEFKAPAEFNAVSTASVFSAVRALRFRIDQCIRAANYGFYLFRFDLNAETVWRNGFELRFDMIRCNLSIT